MKILIFAPYYYPHIGGLEAYANELDKHLAMKGNNVTIFAPRIPFSAAETETINDNIRIIRFPAFEIIHNYPIPKFWNIAFWKFIRQLSNEDFTIIISHTRFFITSLLALIFAKIKKIRHIHIEHGSSFVQSENRLIIIFSWLYDIILGKLVLNNCDHIIAISNSVKYFVKKLAPNALCDVIYRGFDIETIEKIEPNLQLKNQCSEDVIFLFIGRLISGKGVKDLLYAFSKLNRDNIKCFIVGEGPEKKHLQKLASKLNISEKVIFFGRKSFDETIAILKIADIFVNPSYSEGLPTTVIEAAICSKAIIATNVGGTSEIITDKKSGIVIEPKIVPLLHKNMEKLLSDLKYREFLSNNAANEIQKFNWESEIKKIIELFNVKSKC